MSNMTTPLTLPPTHYRNLQIMMTMMSNDHLHPDVVVQPTGVVNAGPGKTADALCAAQQHLHDDEEDNSNDDVLY